MRAWVSAVAAAVALTATVSAQTGSAFTVPVVYHKLLERPPRRDQRGSFGAGGHGRGDVPHRLPHRAEEPDRLRPPVRAHDVPGLRARRQVRARPDRQRERRRAERVDALRPHQLLRGDAVERARAGDVARGRPHAVAQDHAREPQEPAERRQRGSARQRAEPAVRRLRVARPAAEGEHQLVQLAQLLRRPLGHRGRDARRREELLRHLLRAEQRRARRRRRRDAGRGDEARREALRRHPVASAPAAARHQRAAADRGEDASPKATSWRARRRSRSATTCRRA